MSKEERACFLLIKSWDKLPENMKTDEVKSYYTHLKGKTFSLVVKRIFDILMSLMLIILLFPILAVIALIIKLEDRGSVFYRQVRVTQYGKEFKIFKFRTMIVNADKIGSLVTTEGDSRITGIGNTLRKYRLDELPQLFNILSGEMTFVGTRPEVPKYVREYTDEMRATLLLPAGVTSRASIEFKDENKYISDKENVDKIYIEEVLPKKMNYNLLEIREFSLKQEFIILISTLRAVIS